MNLPLSDLGIPSGDTVIKLSTLLPLAVVFAHLVPRSIPGPFLAKFSDIWLGWVSSLGHRSDVVHELHKKYGPLVRLAPNHVSVADPDTLQVVYAHGNGSLKSDFYDAFVSIQSVLEFEPIARSYMVQLFQQWDRLYDSALKGNSGDDGEGGWYGRDGMLWFDCLPLQVAVSHKDAMGSYGSEHECEVIHIPAVQILNRRGEYSASMGVLPPHWRPYARLLPWYRQGSEAVENLAGIAVAAVAKRLTTPTDRVDLLSKLQEGRDDEGRPMGKEELTAEALTQLIAGSDTTSNSSCAISYYIALHPRVQEKLQKELDEASGTEDDGVFTYEQVKRLPYLEAVINEGLRVHSTSSLGLPRVAPEGGLTIKGVHFPQGTVLSVPTYTIHRDTQAWGEDADQFRPERWFERDHAAMQKAFNPFSYGPRACVGRNLASMELLIIISSIFRRYHFVLAEPDKPLDTREGFLRKPLECRVGIKRRGI
ncbi:cytochrome P450 [Pisolithus orientalis]|uniref:cytochrome P450 n=1 Tax=Pisolithus orientalis TaxID=936130 RepID=UPI00222480D3|nr:cytochrome P450 [Pisolithus orientalis]KAI6019956.1 cytochrome P450 [Pisolithus orientalis]